jgi:hypothetical protein
LATAVPPAALISSEVRAGHGYTIVKPPLTDRTCPVIHDESGDTRNRAALAMSCGSPMRPSG